MKQLVFDLLPKRIKTMYVWHRHVHPVCKGLAKRRRGNKGLYILIATPSHGNMGDQAIVYAQTKLIERITSSNQIIEFTNEQFELCGYLISDYVDADDMIIIDGGGNMGSIWPENELKMQRVVSMFANNKVVIFPNTMYYSDDDPAKQLLLKSQEVYTKHKRLTIMARDYTSFQLMKTNYPSANIIYSPDIVLSLGAYCFPEITRDGVMLCFRKDRERVVVDELQTLTGLLDAKNVRSWIGDTLVDGGVNGLTRETKLIELLKVFATAEVVITDRLHAMIFCSLTGTPCVVLDNISKKVSGTLNWIEYLPYIVKADKIEDVMTLMYEIKENRTTYYQSVEMQSKFNQILELLR